MNERTLRVLEYNKILELLAEQAVSRAAKQLARDLEPSDSVYDIREMLSETSEAVSVIVQKGTIPIGGINDILPALKFAVKGGTLSPK